jgi:hypothetical protein
MIAKKDSSRKEEKESLQRRCTGVVLQKVLCNRPIFKE